MTLPKTHPLYGAVEALAIPLFVERTGLLPSEWYRDNLDGYQDGRKQCLKSACETIRALEAAGYRVVGPEPTPEMVTGAIEGMSVYGLARSILAAGIAAAPTITETEKGG